MNSISPVDIDFNYREIRPLKSSKNDSLEDISDENANQLSDLHSNSIKKRNKLTEEQLALFEAVFEQTPIASAKTRAELCARTGLSDRVIQVWFQNRRAKFRLAQKRASLSDILKPLTLNQNPSSSHLSVLSISAQSLKIGSWMRMSKKINDLSCFVDTLNKCFDWEFEESDACFQIKFPFSSIIQIILEANTTMTTTTAASSSGNNNSVNTNGINRFDGKLSIYISQVPSFFAKLNPQISSTWAPYQDFSENRQVSTHFIHELYGNFYDLLHEVTLLMEKVTSFRSITKISDHAGNIKSFSLPIMFSNTKTFQNGTNPTFQSRSWRRGSISSFNPSASLIDPIDFGSTTSPNPQTTSNMNFERRGSVPVIPTLNSLPNSNFFQSSAAIAAGGHFSSSLFSSNKYLNHRRGSSLVSFSAPASPFESSEASLISNLLTVSSSSPFIDVIPVLTVNGGSNDTICSTPATQITDMLKETTLMESQQNNPSKDFFSMFVNLQQSESSQTQASNVFTPQLLVQEDPLYPLQNFNLQADSLENQDNLNNLKNFKIEVSESSNDVAEALFCLEPSEPEFTSQTKMIQHKGTCLEHLKIDSQLLSISKSMESKVLTESALSITPPSRMAEMKFFSCEDFLL